MLKIFLLRLLQWLSQRLCGKGHKVSSLVMSTDDLRTPQSSLIKLVSHLLLNSWKEKYCSSKPLIKFSDIGSCYSEDWLLDPLIFLRVPYTETIESKLSEAKQEERVCMLSLYYSKRKYMHHTSDWLLKLVQLERTASFELCFSILHQNNLFILSERYNSGIGRQARNIHWT